MQHEGGAVGGLADLLEAAPVQARGALVVPVHVAHVHGQQVRPGRGQEAGDRTGVGHGAGRGGPGRVLVAGEAAELRLDHHVGARQLAGAGDERGVLGVGQGGAVGQDGVGTGRHGLLDEPQVDGVVQLHAHGGGGVVGQVAQGGDEAPAPAPGGRLRRDQEDHGAVRALAGGHHGLGRGEVVGAQRRHGGAGVEGGGDDVEQVGAHGHSPSSGVVQRSAGERSPST